MQTISCFLCFSKVPSLIAWYGPLRLTIPFRLAAPVKIMKTTALDYMLITM